MIHTNVSKEKCSYEKYSYVLNSVVCSFRSFGSGTNTDLRVRDTKPENDFIQKNAFLIPFQLLTKKLCKPRIQVLINPY